MIRKILKEKVLLNKVEHEDYILNSFVTVNGKKCFIDYKNSKIIVLLASDVNRFLVTMVEMEHKIVLTDDEVQHISSVVMPRNAYSAIERKLAPLAEDSSVVLDSVNETITLYNNKLCTPVSIYHKDKPIFNKFMKQYKILFPQLDDLLKAIVYTRVTPMKQSFFYIVAPSNWGKSLLMKSIHLAGVGVEIKNVGKFLKNTDTSSVSGEVLSKSACLIFDEFKYFIDELKDITFSLTIAEKFKMQQTIDVGLKIMFSANRSASLESGIDKQLLNRIMLLDIKSDLMITDIPIFREIGSVKALKFLSHYISDYVKNTLEIVKKEDEPYRYAEKEMLKIASKYDIRKDSNIEELSDTISDVLKEYCKDNPFKDNLVIMTDEGALIKRPKKTMERILTEHLDTAKVKHCMSYYSKYVSESFVVNHMKTGKKINGKVHKGYFIKMNWSD